MVLTQRVNRGRCDECKRRKKRCVGDGPICEFCAKKGYNCTNHNQLQILHFEGPSKKKKKPIEKLDTSVSNTPSVQPQLYQVSFDQTEPIEPNFIDPQLQDSQLNIQEVMTPRPSKQSLPLPSSNPITQSSLIKIIKDNLPHGTEIIAPDGLDLDKAPQIYLPRQKLEPSNPNSSDPPILHDEIIIKVFSSETVIPKEFSLLDFLLSSTRVNFVDLSTCHLEEPVSFSEIEKLLKVSRSKKTMDILKEKGYLVSSKTSNLRDAPPSPISPDSSTKSLVAFKSKKDVDFTIDLENLRTNFFIQQGSVAEEVETEHQRFSNLPDFIEPEFADELFQRFCAISQETSYSTLDLGSLPNYEEPFETSKEYVRINFLKVCFPLIFGNISVLKCVLIISYYRWKNIDPTNEYLLQKEKFIEELHLGVLEELQHRLTNCFSICCDHSLLCVLLLLSTEVVIGLRGSLWGKLLKLSRDMIVLRGGVPKLLETLTGLCLLKLLSVHLSVGGLFSFDVNEIDNATHSLSLADFFHIIDSHHQLDFFDNLNYYSKLGLNDMKDIMRTYGHITQLYNLSVISYDANNENGQNSLKRYGNYESVSLTNMELVLSDAETLEKDIQQYSTISQLGDNINLPHHHKSQAKFAQKASLLYLYQMVYRQTSFSPKTVLAVKDLVKEVEQLFDELQNLSIEESQRSVIFIMPFFLLGVDLISNHKRNWYKEELERLYLTTKKAPLMTCVELLEKVWEINATGSIHVDWKAIAQKYELDICLCA